MKRLLMIVTMMVLTVSTASARESSREVKDTTSRSEQSSVYKERQEEENNLLGHYFGASAGTILGSGIAYRYFPDNLGIQFTIAPFYNEGTTLIEGGVGLFLKLHEAENNKFYLYGGASAMYFEQITSYYYQQMLTYNIGAGYGLSWNLSRNICIDCSVGIAYYNISSGGTTQDMFMPAFDCGIFYCF